MSENVKAPQLRFKEFEGNWEKKRLGDVIEIATRLNTDNEFDKQSVLSVSDEFGVVNQIEFQGRSFAADNVSNYKKAFTGDIIYTRSPLASKPFGIIKIVEKEEGILSPLYIVNIPKENNDAKFIYYRFDSPERTNNYLLPLVRKGAKNTMNISNEEWLSGNIIVSPTKAEQQKIGKFFSKLDENISLHQKKLDKLKKLKTAYLNEMFPQKGEKVPKRRFDGFSGDWVEKKLRDFVTFFSGLTYSPSDVTNKGTLVLRSSNVQEGEIELLDNVYVESRVVNVKNVEAGDIIVVVRNGSRSLIGKHALVKSEMPNTVIGAFMTGIKAENPDFVNSLLSAPAFETEVSKNLGATINQITGYMFERMTFLIPNNKDEQQKIGLFFREIDEQISIYQKELVKLKKLKLAYLQEMFV